MRKILLLLIACSALSLMAQELNPKHLEDLYPRNIGPAGMSGRITTIVGHPTNQNIFYVGAASGGVWKTINGGVSWNPIFDDQPIQNIGAIALNPKNPEEIWVGTGEGNPRNSMNSGAGIFKSNDGGKSWVFKGLKNTKTIHRIIVDPISPSTIYVGSLGSIWGPNPERGVFKSTNDGKNWIKILKGKNNTTGAADLVMDKNNPNILIAAMWDFERKPYTFRSGGPGSGLFKTVDGGKSWKAISEKDGLPKGELGRIGLAISESSPEVVYAIIEAEKNALFKSTDGGENWTKHSEDENMGNRPFYYSDIFVDPTNENHIFSLWTNVSESIDGGKNWKKTLMYQPFSGVHPDHHSFFIHPQNSKLILEGNDGGLNISRDGGKTWRFIDNIPVGQFYHVDHDMSFPFRVGGGMQDNGSWVGPAYKWQKGAIRNYDFREVRFGDGFDVAFHPKDPNTVYAMSQSGYVGAINLQSGYNNKIRPFSDDSIKFRYNWDAAMALDPFNPDGLYFGAQYLFHSKDRGQNWKKISQDLTTNDAEKQKQEESGGLTPDVTEAENYTTLTCIAAHKKQKGTIYVGSDDGQISKTTDGGKNWQNINSKLLGLPKNAWIHQIVLSDINNNEIFIAINNYRQNDWRHFLYHSKETGKTIKNIASNGLLGYVRSVIQDIEVPNLLFCGTDQGLFYSTNYGKKWIQWKAGFPACPVSDLKIHPREKSLVIGTFGRSIWILDELGPLRAIASNSINLQKDSLKMFPIQDSYLAKYASVDGSRFLADGSFEGKNLSYGARIYMWIPPHKFDKKDKIKFIIQNEKGDTIRKFTNKVDTGIVAVYWNLRRDGIPFPSYKPIDKEKDIPSFFSVIPGKYLIKASYKSFVDSSNVLVHQDPRVPQNNYSELTVYQDSVLNYIKKVNYLHDKLLAAEKAIDWSKNAFSYLPKDKKGELDSLSSDLKTQIDSIQEFLLGKEKTKGIYRTNELFDYLRMARSYIGEYKEINQNAKNVLKKIESEYQIFNNRVNHFLDTEWKAFEAAVEKEQSKAKFDTLLDDDR